MKFLYDNQCFDGKLLQDTKLLNNKKISEIPQEEKSPEKKNEVNSTYLGPIIKGGTEYYSAFIYIYNGSSGSENVRKILDLIIKSKYYCCYSSKY